MTTETMLVHGINDTSEELERIAEVVTELNVDKGYLSIPTRPPAEKWVNPPTEQAINRAYQCFCEHALDVEYLIGYEGNAFAWTGNVAEHVLRITSVHPMREDECATVKKLPTYHLRTAQYFPSCAVSIGFPPRKYRK